MAAGDQTSWRNSGGQAVETARIEDVLTKLSNLRADAFQPSPHASLKVPVVTVVVRFDDNRTETVAFGRDGNAVYAARQDEPGSARVDTALFDEAMKAADALK
jgi:hypothetical protein